MVVKPDQIFPFYITSCTEFGYVIPTRANISYVDRWDAIPNINTRVLLNSAWKANTVVSEKAHFYWFQQMSDAAQFLVLEDQPTHKKQNPIPLKNKHKY